MDRAGKHRNEKLADKTSKPIEDASPAPAGQKPTLTIQQAIELGVHRHGAGDLSKAARIYQQILQSDPNQPEALHFLGVIAHQVGKHETALESIRKALAIKPDYAEAHNSLGISLKEQGKLDESVISYHKALDINPNYAMAHYNLGIALKEQGKLGDAVASYHKALAIEPEHAESHSNLGNALKEQGKLDDAITSYHKSLAIKPEGVEAHGGLGIALKQQGKLDDAVASFRKAIAIKPEHAESHSNLGSALKEQGKLDDAISSYHKALVIKPDYALVHYNLGNALQELGKSGDAIAAYGKALSINPSYAEAWNNLKFVVKIQQVSPSSDSRNKRFNTNELNPASDTAMYLALQQLYLDEHRQHEADESFDNVIKALPTMVEETIPIHLGASRQTDTTQFPNKLVVLLSYGRSGTGLLHSLIDGHPEISTLPSIYLRGYFNSGVWGKLSVDGWRGLPARFVDEFAVLFDARTSKSIPSLLGETSTFVGRKEGMTSVGDNRDEFLSVDKDRFCRSATRQLEHMENVDPMSFLRVVHAAYEDATGMTPVSDTAKHHCFYHIHNPDDFAKCNFLRYAPHARVLMMVREPIANCGSAIRGDIWANHHDQCVHRLLGILFGFDQVLFRRRESVGVRLEDLKARPEATLQALCTWLGVEETPTLYEMTAQGKKWWGDPSSPSYSDDKAMSPFGDAPMKHAANTTFGETDQFVLKTLFYPFRVRFGYCEPEPAQFQKDLKAVRPLLDEMFDFEKAMAVRMNVDYEQFKRRGSYQLFRAGLNDRWDVLNELGDYPHMLKPLNIPSPN